MSLKRLLPRFILLLVSIGAIGVSVWQTDFWWAMSVPVIRQPI